MKKDGQSDHGRQDEQDRGLGAKRRDVLVREQTLGDKMNKTGGWVKRDGRF